VAIAALALTAVIAVFVGLSFLTAPRPTATTETLAGADVLGPLQPIPAATFASVGTGNQPMQIQRLPATPVLKGDSGKPLVFYGGAEYCPFCAALRWPLVVALSRFGTFNGLKLTTSADAPETFPGTPSLSFHKATYASAYIELSTVESETRTRQPLETPTAAQQKLVATYDKPPYVSRAGAIPLLDLGNQYLLAGGAYTPALLAGLTWQQVSAAIVNPGTPQAQAVIGNANYITAAICRLTGDQPADTCQTTPIATIEAQLSK